MHDLLHTANCQRTFSELLSFPPLVVVSMFSVRLLKPILRLSSKAFRSTLPLGFIGKAAICIKTTDAICPGSFACRYPRNASGVSIPYPSPRGRRPAASLRDGLPVLSSPYPAPRDGPIRQSRSPQRHWRNPHVPHLSTPYPSVHFLELLGRVGNDRLQPSEALFQNDCRQAFQGHNGLYHTYPFRSWDKDHNVCISILSSFPLVVVRVS
jgi:hypothetical protein